MTTNRLAAQLAKTLSCHAEISDQITHKLIILSVEQDGRTHAFAYLRHHDGFHRPGEIDATPAYVVRTSGPRERTYPGLTPDLIKRLGHWLVVAQAAALREPKPRLRGLRPATLVLGLVRAAYQVAENN